MDWRPGEIAVVHRHGWAANVITVMQVLSGVRGDWEHVIVGLEPPWIVEAEPGGAVKRRMHYAPADVWWSSGRLNPAPTDGQLAAIAAAAVKYTEANGGRGVGYSWADYGAIAAKAWHLPAPGLDDFVADTGHMQCAQLTAASCRDGGYPLYPSWTGFVRPGDIAVLLGAPRRSR